MDNMKVTDGFVFAAYNKVHSAITTNDNDKGIKKYAKLGAGLVAHPVFALAIAVETVVRGILALLAKMVHFFMPKDAEITRKFENKVLLPLVGSTGLNGALAVLAGATTGLNFTKDETKEAARDAIFSPLGSIVNSKALDTVLNAHINGIYHKQTL